MNKLSKRFLLIGGGVAALIGVVMAGMDLYAGSQSVRERLETALSRKAGMPVKVDSLHFNFWSGLVARGVVAAPPEECGSSAELPRVAATVSWLPLFSHKFHVKRLVLSDPVVVLTQDAEGDWKVPLKCPKAAPEAKALPSEVQPAPSAEPPKAVVKPRKPRVEFMIRSARVENATLRLLDHEGNNIAVLEGINVECPRGLKGDVEGRLSIRKATFRDGWTVESVSTPFAFNGTSLTLPDLALRLGGGTVRGKMSATELKKDAPFTLNLLIDEVDLHNLQMQIQGEQPACKTAGILQGSVDIYGLLGRKKSVTGSGQVRILHGRMSQVPLLQTIGKALSIDELTCLELQQAQLDLRAGEGKVHIESLVIESPNLSLSAKGTSSWSGKLALDARLLASSKVTRQLPQAVESNFQAVPGSERKALAFHITGTVDHPQTDLMRVLVGQRIESEVLNVFRALTGKGKKKQGGASEPPHTAEPVAIPDH